MEKDIKNWAEQLRINPPENHKDSTWDYITKNIKSRRQSSKSFWDTKVLLIFTVITAAVFAYIIIALILGKGLPHWV